MWNYGWPIGPGKNILNIWLTLRASHKSAWLAFGPKFMSRLVRLARSPCRLGPSYRKSVNLKNVSFSAFLKSARLAGRVKTRVIMNRFTLGLGKFGSLREPNFRVRQHVGLRVIGVIDVIFGSKSLVRFANQTFECECTLDYG